MIYIILKCFKRSTFLSFFACLVIFTWISYIVNFILLLIFLYTYKYLFVCSGTKLNYLKIICCFYFLLSWNESSVYFRANSALLLRLNSYDYSTWIPCDLQFIHLLLMETGTIPGPESLWGFSLLCYFRVLLSHPWTMFLYLCIDFSWKLNRRASLHISGNFSLFSSLISSTLFYNAYVFWSPQTPSSVASFQGPRLAASGFPFPACDLETFYRYEELTELKGSTSKEKQTEMS